MSRGCLEYCSPRDIALRFAEVVLEYSLLDKCRMARSGKYLSPVKEEGRPLLVLHFCAPHRTKEFDGDLEPRYLPPASLYRFTASCAFLADQCPAAVPCTLSAMMRFLIRSQSWGFVRIDICLNNRCCDHSLSIQTSLA